MVRGWAIGLGAGAVLCATIGAVIGRDAAGQVDRFYTSTHFHAERPAPVVEDAAWDWNESPRQPTEIPAGGAVWLDGGGTGSRGDGATLTEIDRAVERAAPVRVHRSRPARPAPAVEPDPTDIDIVPATPAA